MFSWCGNAFFLPQRSVSHQLSVLFCYFSSSSVNLCSRESLMDVKVKCISAVHSLNWKLRLCDINPNTAFGKGVRCARIQGVKPVVERRAWKEGWLGHISYEQGEGPMDRWRQKTIIIESSRIRYQTEEAKGLIKSDSIENGRPPFDNLIDCLRNSLIGRDVVSHLASDGGKVDTGIRGCFVIIYALTIFLTQQDKCLYRMM